MKHLATQPNARVLVLMTPGFPAEKGMESRVSALLDTALRGQIRVTGMQVLGKGVPLSIARREFIGQAAKATGGVFVDGYADPDATLRQLVTARPICTHSASRQARPTARRISSRPVWRRAAATPWKHGPNILPPNRRGKLPNKGLTA